MSGVHRALISCPNITSLRLRVTLLGCSSWPDRWSFPFALDGKDTYPNLRTLHLEGYDFDQREWNDLQSRLGPMRWYERWADWIFSGKAFKQISFNISLSAEQREKDNLDLWLDAMDWGMVEELALADNRANYTYFFGKASKALTGLQRLQLDGGEVNETIQILKALADNGVALTNFTWTDNSNSYPQNSTLPTIAKTHGQSLLHLDVHSIEAMSTSGIVFSATEIEHLQQMPNLNHLSLNLPRNGTWPLESLSAIAGISPLRTLDLWLDIMSECRRQKTEPHHWRPYPDEVEGCTEEEQFLRPYANETTANEVFEFMRSKKLGNELESVTFWVGDWGRPWDGPLYEPSWVENRRAKISCNVVAERCVVEEGNNYWSPDNSWREMDPEK
ncbi:hypothetical protein P152DRAFT_455742 [Eremomyces bilateralis CBS 781.70]|uniref:Uncharacterized protein n=1 Tax=Eremomyces bilateralis CBS 781.70 TaxID=1392243 RepID=A0A6G1G9C6_9PEZI|nr:uncharacterized protein P152DRAFT_455742 [Eremomyces bilateralis CBS 781.70]KAF1814695.1 hypothetical protein P152DRAFT_455742 [Eremomyces bilateralis CBS 781.70]